MELDNRLFFWCWNIWHLKFPLRHITDRFPRKIKINIMLRGRIRWWHRKSAYSYPSYRVAEIWGILSLPRARARSHNIKYISNSANKALFFSFFLIFSSYPLYKPQGSSYRFAIDGVAKCVEKCQFQQTHTCLIGICGNLSLLIWHSTDAVAARCRPHATPQRKKK
jgi:hypothetical protein